MFIIEGDKIITDLLNSGELNENNMVYLCATGEWFRSRKGITNSVLSNATEAETRELKKLSSMVTPPDVLAVVKFQEAVYSTDIIRNGISLVFDTIRDPGNMGTIIRTADWFGYKNLFCSPDSVDRYNSKVVQSSMGGIMRVQTHYTDLEKLFMQAERMKIPVYGTTMDGKDFFETPVKQKGMIVFGNESTGISKQFEPYFTRKISIPDFPAGKSATESLNVASSVAIICAELRRRKM